MIKTAIILFQVLPEIIRFLEHLEQTKKNNKIKEDLIEINEAFETRNPDKLNDIFRSLSDN